MQPQVQKLLSGGLNLLAPADSITSGQAIACENWRSDQVGILRSRKGMTLVHTYAAAVNSIIDVLSLSPTRYFGVGTALYRATTSIATGFDANPLNMLSFQGRFWVMNQAKQVKDDGTTCFNWTPAPPTAVPTPIAPLNAPSVATAGTGTGSVTGTFEYYATALNA